MTDPSKPLFTSPVNEASGLALPAGTRWQEFELERVLSQSRAAVVYLATDHALELTVAIKEYLPRAHAVRNDAGEVRPRTGDSEEVFRRGLQAFVHEARILAHCDHPSLVRVTRVWESRGTACCVMPWYPGPHLSEVCEGRVIPSEADVLAWLDGLLGALEVYHGVDTVHGAVHPGNILIRPDGSPLLFGPGRASQVLANDLIEALMARVEHSYLAPEQVDDNEAATGPWTDLHALAAVMRFVLTGERPAIARKGGLARSEPLAQALERLLGADAAAAYRRELLDALDAALSPQPKDRPQNVAQFRERLPFLASAAPARRPMPFVRAPAAPPPMEPPLAADRTQAPPAVRPADPRGSRKAWWMGATLAGLMAGAWFLVPPDVAREHRAEPAVHKPDVQASQPTAQDSPPAAAPLREPEPLATTPAPAPAVPEAEADARPEARPNDETGAKVAAPPPAATKPVFTSPRQACGERTQFSLYRCMQRLCETSRWSSHPQCERLRQTDSVGD